MKIKLTVEVNGAKPGTIVDCDETKAKDLLSSKSAVEYTAEAQAADENEIKERVDATVKEKTMTAQATDMKPSGIEVVKDPSGEWKDMGEFLNAVKSAEEKHTVDPRLVTKASAGLGEDSNGVGGYLVQHPLWNQEIFKAYMQSAVIAPKCRQFVAEPYANGLKFKQIAETVRSATSQWGGVRFYEVDEGVDITDSKPVFQQVDCPIKQMGSLYYLTQALVDDCPNISQYVAGIVGQSYGRMIDNEILNGTLGICTPVVGHLSTVAKTVAGNNPTAAEWLAIYNAVSPGYRAGAEWYMSIATYNGLLSLSTPILATGGLSGLPLVTRDFKEPTTLLLLGHKVNVMEQMTAQGTAGNIVFGNFSEYALVTKGSLTPSVAMSLHVKFLSNQQTYRFISRLGGIPLLYSKVQMEDGSIVSNMATRN